MACFLLFSKESHICVHPLPHALRWKLAAMGIGSVMASFRLRGVQLPLFMCRLLAVTQCAN